MLRVHSFHTGQAGLQPMWTMKDPDRYRYESYLLSPGRNVLAPPWDASHGVQLLKNCRGRPVQLDENGAILLRQNCSTCRLTLCVAKKLLVER